MAIRFMEVLIIAVVATLIAYQVYAYIYFKSDAFIALKRDIRDYALDCNELNDHIEDLKHAQSQASAIDYGSGQLVDQSRYNFKRSNWSKTVQHKHVHNCTASVCKNASEQPFKYLCKYFGIKTNEPTLSNYESMLNDFAAAEQGKSFLVKKKDEIIAGISDSIPVLIRTFSRPRLERKLGFNPIDLGHLYFPIYTFQYVSAGGNSSMKVDVKFDVENIERFVGYLSELVKFRKSVAGQRALMTQALRKQIKERDDYSCQMCGLSAQDERNLLLEIDHIVPLSKGGITSEDNLQTLCWRCNRSKGAKILN
jgi:hypothetical protein